MLVFLSMNHKTGLLLQGLLWQGRGGKVAGVPSVRYRHQPSGVCRLREGMSATVTNCQQLIKSTES